ncbi:nuclear transport factor 2 family protein [Algoriphagus lutimaris]|uniref:nuclear transport factor 2 family protein n=1 Tax=Algoriphagus lutimaris TaxID=613197 RepID=UPI00196A71DB|nr:nuclear transport factor 2 family protein [Algoriphagus lutimaris]MBN3521500.1 nuclear transport factor 2 family protein [Algoriphagus lutimaris]
MKVFVCTLLLFTFLNFESACQSANDRDLIVNTVQLYFEGMMERDKSKLEAAFIPEARLIGFRGEHFTITSFESWAEGTSKGEPRNSIDFKNEIVSIRVQGNAASVETELYWPGIYYYDFLTLLKIDGDWKIVNKSWSERGI